MNWRSRLAVGTYSLLMGWLTPAYLWRLWLRGRVEPMYRERMGERFGFYRGEHSAGWVWLHAVSLGETRAAAALIEALRARRPGMRLLLTHGTGTGREAGADLLRPGDLQTWLPFDTPGAVKRFFRHFRPAVGVLMETEVWPNLLLEAHRQRVPMVLANARLSERSRRRGARLDVVMRPVAGTFARVLAQTEADAARLRDSGAPNVEVVGNLKFDMAPDPALVARGHGWRAWSGRRVLMFAISREGEEAMLLDAWMRLTQPAPATAPTTAPANAPAMATARAPVLRPLLLIVPRHPQRFDEVAALIEGRGLSLVRRSRWGTKPPPGAFEADAWLGDSMREMPLYYGLANVALLGGSFAPLGGQNLIEAAACGCPVVMGPHTFNFAEAAEGSLAAGAALRASDMSTALEAALALLADDARLEAAARSGLRFAEHHRGAAVRMAQRIAELLPRA